MWVIMVITLLRILITPLVSTHGSPSTERQGQDEVGGVRAYACGAVALAIVGPLWRARLKEAIEQTPIKEARIRKNPKRPPWRTMARSFHRKLAIIWFWFGLPDIYP